MKTDTPFFIQCGAETNNKTDTYGVRLVVTRPTH